MPVFRGHGVSVLFVHVPKTGGTTVESVFRSAGFAEELFSPDERHSRWGVYPQHLAAQQLKAELGDTEFDFGFLIVRDPIARLGSERAFRERLIRSAGGAIQPYETWAARMMRRAAEDAAVYDNHIRPQVDFLLPGLTVYRFEDGIDRIQADVARRLGVPLLGDVPTPKTQRGHGTSDRAFDRLPEPVREDVIGYYIADYAVFGYPLPEYSTAPVLPERDRLLKVDLTPDATADSGQARGTAWWSRFPGFRHPTRNDAVQKSLP